MGYFFVAQKSKSVNFLFIENRRHLAAREPANHSNLLGKSSATVAMRWIKNIYP